MAAFVARDPELARLQTFLDRAKAGETQVCFITGEAGAGKSALLDEFTRRAQDSDPGLLAATGTCSAQTGQGDPYHPFREVLALLTGNVDSALATGRISDESATRLKQALRLSRDAIVEFAPDIVGLFVPGFDLVSGAALFAADKAGLLDRFKKRQETLKTGEAKLSEELVFQQYTDVLRALAKNRPLIVVIDDLHWADAPSIGLLFHLARQLKDSPILLIGAYRPEDVAIGRGEDRHPLEGILNEVRRYRGDVWIDLNKTQAERGRAFVNALMDSEPNRLSDGFRAALFRHTGGQPLFTVETLRNMEERGDLVKSAEGEWIEAASLDWGALPARVEGVIEERIGRLQAELRDMLTIASVEGESFIAQVLARVQEVEERRLIRRLAQELEKQHRLVQETGVTKVGPQRLITYTFTHALFQQYLYSGLSTGERMILHGQVAEVLEALYEGETDPVAVQLARHYTEAGSDDKAVAYLMRAGERAYQVHGVLEARHFFSQALDRVASLEGPDRTHREAELKLKVGHTYRATSDYAEAQRWITEALALAESLGDQKLQERCHGALGDCARWMGHFAEAREHYETCRTISEALNYEAGISAATLSLGIIAARTGNLAGAEQMFKDTLAIDTRLDDPRGMALAYNSLGIVCRMQGRYAEARQHYEESLRLRREIGDKLFIADTLNNLGNLVDDQDDYPAALRYHREALATYEEIGERRRMSVSLNNLGSVLEKMGQVEEALGYFERGLALDREIGAEADIANALGNIGAMHERLNRFDLARACYRESLDLAARLDMPSQIATMHTRLGNVARQTGDYAAARQHYDTALPLARQLNELPDVCRITNGLGSLHNLLGEPAQARAHFAASLALLEELKIPRLTAAALLGLAEALAAEGDPVQAIRLAALVAQHPNTQDDDRASAVALRDAQRDQLPTDACAAAVAEGEALDLDTVVAMYKTREVPPDGEPQAPTEPG